MVGRLPVVVHLDPLDLDVLRQILTKPRNALLRQYRKLFELEGIDLEFKPEAIDFIAEKALEYKLGARGLRSLCEAILTDAMFDLPAAKKSSKHLVVDHAYAASKLERSRVGRLKAA